jgi:protein-S-isoprenylcysteine O-methyltransferase Ste14
MITYETVIISSWVIFIGVWIILSFGVKRDIKGGGFSSWWSQNYLLRLLVLAFGVFVAVRLLGGTAHYAKANAVVFGNALFTPPIALGWVAAVLSVAGVGFAVWARIYLGRNWSSAPAIKENHELVTSGPYAAVRHPIYTGLILTALGTALSGTIFGLIVLIVAASVFFRRIDKEERIMLELFPSAYPPYQARTKKLIPWVW